MGRRQIDSNSRLWASATLLFLGFVSCTVAFLFISNSLKPRTNQTLPNSISNSDIFRVDLGEGNGSGGSQCCRGIPNLELWGSVVKWGSDYKFNSSEECCDACKAMCSGKDGDCVCDSWVFCGDFKACGSRFGECWLKKQEDTLAPQIRDTGNHVIWTSGLIFGKGKEIMGLETELGTLRIKLRPDCAPHSVSNILELLAASHCAGCQLYRAEGRGDSWDIIGNHIKDASYGPPSALIQGTLEASGVLFKKVVPTEHSPTVTRGAVAWVESGPEIFISLANHREWKGSYTVFGYVLLEDMQIADRIAELPTKTDVWSNVKVSVLQNPLPILITRLNLTQRR